MLNFSLISLSVASLKTSPFITHAKLSQRSKFLVSNCKFSKHANSLFFTNSFKTSCFFHKTNFEKFLNSVILMRRTPRQHCDEVFSNKSVVIKITEEVEIIDCRFTRCFASEQTAVCIYSEHVYIGGMSLTIERTAFTQIAGGSLGAAIYYVGSKTLIKNCCFLKCVTQLRFQSYYIDGSEFAHVSEVVKDQCSPRKPMGYSFSEHIRGENVSVVNCNNTRCRVIERRCCASFGANVYMKYRFGINNNNSGMTYFGFNLDSNKWYELSDVMIIMCHGSLKEYGILETSKMIVLKRFIFIKTKMLWMIAYDVMQAEEYNSVGGEALFIDCVTDTPAKRFVNDGKNVSFKNLTIISRMSFTFTFNIDYENWLCVTDIPRTPDPTPTASLKRTPAMTQNPSMTMPLFDLNEGKMELIEIDHSDDESITKSDIIQLVFLSVLTAVTVFVFFLVSKKRKAHLKNISEEEKLIQA